MEILKVNCEKASCEILKDIRNSSYGDLHAALSCHLTTEMVGYSYEARHNVLKQKD